MIRCRVYWRDDVDGEDEPVREPDTPPGTCRQRQRSEVRGQRSLISVGGEARPRTVDLELEGHQNQKY